MCTRRAFQAEKTFKSRKEFASTMCFYKLADVSEAKERICLYNLHMCTGDVSGRKKLKPKKEFAYKFCARPPSSAMPKPSFLCAPAFSRSICWWFFRGGSEVAMWCDVMWCCMMSCGWLRGEMKQCGSLWSDVRGGKVVRCEMSRHVMPCDVTSCDVVTCHVWWCGVMSCHVISRHVIWRDVMWRCQGTGCYAVVMRCACAMWLAVKSCYVVQSGRVLWWIGRWCAVL